MTRKQYRAAWVRRDYKRRRADGICTRCPRPAKGWLCEVCVVPWNEMRVAKGRY